MMRFRQRWALAAAALALLALGIACSGSDGDGTTVTDPSPTTTRPEVSPTLEPTATAEAPPPTPVLTPSQEVLSFLGETIAFDFPANWHVLERSYESEKETVVLANIPRDVGVGSLPPEAIRIEFTGGQREPLEPLPGEEVDRFIISGVTFTLSEGEEVPWVLRGSFVIGGIDFRYLAIVQMNTSEPEMDILTPILDSWVIGSTGNHPSRSCLPGECP